MFFIVLYFYFILRQSIQVEYVNDVVQQVGENDTIYVLFEMASNEIKMCGTGNVEIFFRTRVITILFTKHMHILTLY